jgi:hypothetical protein
MKKRMKTMKTMKTAKIYAGFRRRVMRAILSPILSLLALTACISEGTMDFDPGYTQETAGNEAQVNFSVVVPARAQALATKSLSDEGAVNIIHLLLFEEVNGAKVYRFRTQVNNIAAVSPTHKTFQTKLPAGVYDIVVLANAREILDGSGILFGSTKEDVLGALVETGSGQWNGSAIPMWGQRDDQTVNDRLSFTGNNAIQMIRMIAKVEVEVAPEVAGTNDSNFSLTDIRLYNYSSQGALVPDPAVWPADNIAVTPTEPAVPDGFARKMYPASAPLVFTERSFYTYEAPAGTSGAGMASSICLVIGGSYQGRAVSYYRVDFTGNGTSPNFLPLLRNCRYVVRIVKVKGDGFPTPELAFETVNAGMEVNVLGWNDGGVGEVLFDGQNTLEISQDEFAFPNEQLISRTEDNRLTIRTSAAGGWEIEKITDASGLPHTATWLTASDASFAAPNTSKDIYLFAEENTTGVKRTGYI